MIYFIMYYIPLVNVWMMIKKWATLRVILPKTKPGAKDSLHVASSLQKYV